MGAHLARVTEGFFTGKDKENIQAHVEAVKARGVEFDTEQFSGRQKAKLLEWIEGASNIDPHTNGTEAAAWRAALDDIMTNNSSDLLPVVKRLNREEIELILDVAGGHEVYSPSPTLSQLNLVERGYTINFPRRLINLLLYPFIPLLFIGAVNLQIDYYIYRYGSDSVPLVNTLRNSTSVLLIYGLLLLPIILFLSRRLLRLNLTRKGHRLGEKILSYLPRAEALDRSA